MASRVAAQSKSSKTLTTSDVRVVLDADARAPSLISLSSRPSSADTSPADASPAWRNSSVDALPLGVELDGHTIATTWQLLPRSGRADSHQVVFVYECPEPHLRLTWTCEARASFGPLEHRISVENLGQQETWLPMIDGLAIDWKLQGDLHLHYFYVEKGADTPSAQGTHLKSIADGYHWEGKSSTYARPTEGEARVAK